MPITTTQPIQQNGHTYPYLSVNLAVSPLVEDYIGGSIAMKLTPYREIDPADGGGFEFLDDQAKNVVYLDVFRDIEEGDIVLGQAVSQIMGAIQYFINGKGL
jgi:hypothetical protein